MLLPALHTNGEFDNRSDESAYVPPPGFKVIGPGHSYNRMREWLFVLNSVGLDGSIRHFDGRGFGLVVTDAAYDRAMDQLSTYLAENVEFRARDSKKDEPVYGKSNWSIAIAAMLVAVFALTGGVKQNGAWLRRGVADSYHLLHGAPWEAVTALTLHADAAHVGSNALTGAIFLGAVHRRLGAGIGTFIVLAAGAVGNALNAYSYGHDHKSLGASTAVFAAVGVLAATQVVLHRANKEGFFASAGPLVGGLVLLGLLGANPNTDFRAHGFGFVAGLGLGAFAAIAQRLRGRAFGAIPQWGFGLGSVATVAASWALAWAR